MSLYSTWYHFKRDLEAQLGRPLVNSDWLALKPDGPLPWDQSQLETALVRAERIGQPADHPVLAHV